MIWLVWRRQRAALLVVWGLVAATAALALVVGIVRASGAARIGGLLCLDDAGAPGCRGPALLQLSARFDVLNDLVHVVLLVLPLVVGVVAGAGLFSRELEQGTVVFALTQSVSRRRWWATGLVVAGAPAAAAVALVTPFVTWALWLHRLTPEGSRLEDPVFDITGLVPAAHALLAFTLAAVAGLLLRSALGAVVLAGVVQFVLQVVLVGLRPYFATPAELRVRVGDLRPGAAGLPDGAWYQDQAYLDAAGRVLPDAGPWSVSCDGDVAHDECLRLHGAVQELTTYHDATRYWPFQAIETVILLGVVVVLLVAGRARLRRIA